MKLNHKVTNEVMKTVFWSCLDWQISQLCISAVFMLCEHNTISKLKHRVSPTDIKASCQSPPFHIIHVTLWETYRILFQLGASLQVSKSDRQYWRSQMNVSWPWRTVGTQWHSHIGQRLTAGNSINFYKCTSKNSIPGSFEQWTVLNPPPPPPPKKKHTHTKKHRGPHRLAGN